MDSKNPESHPLFPSGEWEGFYTYGMGPGTSQHRMAFFLDFKDGVVSGSGGDDVGAFNWRGSYDTKQLICQMTKRYATHAVHYDGKVDENGIWGTWIIGDYFKGGFHIWPKQNEQNEEAEQVAEEPEAIEQGKPAKTAT